MSAESKATPLSCEEKLNSLEPPKPKTIYDYELLIDRDLSKFHEEILPIPMVLKKGRSIPYVIVYKDTNWKRPAYAADWHSTYWRWSYVPNNIAYQQHTIFSFDGGGSWRYDLSHYLALPNNVGGPSPINEFAFTIKYPSVVRLIVFHFNIASIKYYKNQILVLGKPMRNGLIIADFDKIRLSQSQKILQLVTPDGYELDYLILL